MQLIGSLASPYVRKVRIVLSEKKIDYKLTLDDVWSSESKILASNPLGKIPCLVMEDGGAIFDSRVIVEYLDGLTPVHKLLPPSGRARIEVKTWEALADGLTDAAILIRTELTQRPENERSQKWIDRQMVKVDSAMEMMSKGLGDRAWCCEGKYTLADIAVGCALGWLDFRFAHIDWRTKYVNLSRHTDKLSLRPSFAETTPRLPPPANT
jgi:glutathione S-transferase